MPRTPRVPCSLGLGSTLRVSEAVSESVGGALCARELQFVRIMCTKSDRGTLRPCTALRGAAGAVVVCCILYMSRNLPPQ